MQTRQRIEESIEEAWQRRLRSDELGNGTMTLAKGNEVISQLLALPAKDLFSLAVIAAVITVVGNLIALFLKEHAFARSFERWKRRRDLESIFQKYRDPIVLAADELSIRFKEICEDDGVDYLASSVLEIVPARVESNWSVDPYYRRYKFESTIYRLCAFFGWCELYRQEVVFLRSGQAEHNSELKDAVDAVREALADGQLNDASNWMEWRDRLIFREEQRAIGESMICNAGNFRTIMGYAQFVDILRDQSGGLRLRWFNLVREFFVDMEAQPLDFRLVRAKALYVRLVDLIAALDGSHVRASHRERRQRFFQELPAFARERLSFQEKKRRIRKILKGRSELRNPELANSDDKQSNSE